MRDHTSVWIIEATGKISCLTKVLESMSFHPEVIATRGHFCKMPDTLSQIGIDKNYHETKRIADDTIVERIKESIRIMMENGGREVYIATDDDAEGNVIAYDVYENIKDLWADPIRVKLTALDKESLQEALNNSGEVKIQEAIPGRTRAIIDRLIGATFASQGISAGRVGSAILGIIAKDTPQKYRADFIAQAIDGGRPWKVSVKIDKLLTREIAQKIISIGFPSLDYEQTTRKITPPNDMGRILVRAGDTMNMSPKDAAKAMQEAYESGSLSYPRASSRGMSSSAAQKISQSIRKTGWKFDKNIIPPRTEGEPHDSPYTIGPIDISLNPERVGSSEGIRIMIARDLLPCGESRKIQKHKKGVISDYLIQRGIDSKVAEYIDSLDWERDFGQPVPGESSNKESKIIERRIDSVILESCLAHDIGKPSTWPNHIHNFIEKGLVDNNLNITDIGRQLLAQTPDLLLNPKFSQAIMKACEANINIEGDQPWENLAKRIVNALPQNIKEQLISATETPQITNADKEKVFQDLDL